MLISLLLAGCEGSSRPSGSGPQPTPVPAQALDVTVTSPAPDNLLGGATTAIAATVFVPAHRPGEKYPLILHSHGWGGNRIDASDAQTNNQNADTSTLYSRVVDLQVKSFWDAGYAVISFDERGIADSGGAVRVMDPEYETVDAMAILDWAQANLDLATDAGGDPLVGTIGGSYGGGFQLLLAARDARVDAITPSVTWYDLNDALQPGGVLAKGWLAGLCLVAKTDQRRMDAVVQTACEEGADLPTTRYGEDVVLSGAAITAYFREHSLAAFERRHRDPADPYRMPPVHALFVQGQRDTLFSLDHAASGFAFLSELGGDVRLLTHQHGHILPAPFSTNAALGSIACGAHDTIAAIHAFMDAKLRGHAAALDGLPRVCLSLDDAEGIDLDAVPVGGAVVLTVPPTSVTGLDGNVGAGTGPVFVPLAEPIAGSGQVLAGVPTATLSVRSDVPGTIGTAFVAIGIQRGDTPPFPVDYQVQPLRSDRTHDDEALRGVAERLQPGDRVGLLIYGDFVEFEPAGQPLNFVANAVTVEGTVRLPIFAAAGHASR
ncbi:CocE/NonD family hydrolase [Fontimonas sp. SYSU GA230001]|uniref:CocE/NonD family hydrolase n=1 Tax=Fontimonas sp. SYSU GA230001 TaxID=3142450 RepID=UPI0032B33CBB